MDRIIQRAIKEARKTLLENEAKAVCKEYGIRSSKWRLVTNVRDAVKAAARLGFPVVMKIVSPDIMHKTEAGCVEVGLGHSKDVRAAYGRILNNAKRYRPDARLHGMLVEKMQPPGVEVIVGALRDAQFGPTFMFGLGGVLVEILEDVSFRVAPLSERAARDMIHEIKGYAVLKGYRGRAPVDEESLVRILMASSAIMVNHPEISQIDLNPVLAYADRAVAVDARITLA